MEMGKLPKDLLVRLLPHTQDNPNVIVGPAYGEDAAAVLVSREVLVAASDPITFATDQIGWYAVTVNANDIAVTGAVPKYFLATILLPTSSTEKEAADVFTQIAVTCDRLKISLIGGHTEITDAVNRIVVSGVMFGETDRDNLITTSGAQVGDDVLLVGSIAIEGTALLAREAANDLEKAGIDILTIEYAAEFLEKPGICVVNYARAATACSGVHSMHDPTEGGIASALQEIAYASGYGIIVDQNALTILDECRLFCNALGLDPLGLIASGSLLITCDPHSTDNIMEELQAVSPSVTKIGEVTEDPGVVFSDGSLFPEFKRDEIARFFGRKG
jgi:hydrogenase maturation factor